MAPAVAYFERLCDTTTMLRVRQRSLSFPTAAAKPPFGCRPFGLPSSMTATGIHMRQLTLRVADELAERLKDAASERRQSVNSFAQSVLSAAVDPQFAAARARACASGWRARAFSRPPAGRPRRVCRLPSWHGHERLQGAASRR